MKPHLLCARPVIPRMSRAIAGLPAPIARKSRVLARTRNLGAGTAALPDAPVLRGGGSGGRLNPLQLSEPFAQGRYTMKPALFPIFLKLAGRPWLAVAAGPIAESKIASLLDSGAQITVLAPNATAEIRRLAAARRICWPGRKFAPAKVKRAFLVVAALSHREMNRSVFREACERSVHCNSIDDPPNCDSYFPAIVRRGPLQIAISTSGASPTLAQRIRREITAPIPLFDERKRLLHRLACSEPHVTRESE